MLAEQEALRNQILAWSKNLKLQTFGPNAQWRVFKSSTCPDIILMTGPSNGGIKLQVRAEACVVCEASAFALNEFLQNFEPGDIFLSLQMALDYFDGKLSQPPHPHLRVLANFLSGPRATCAKLPWHCALQYLNQGR